jgi:hypothetical protein
MISEEHYAKLLENSESKQRFHTLFQRFPPLIQSMIVNKYSGIFNFYDEIGEDQVTKLCDHLEHCLWTVQEEALYNAYKEII